MLCEIPRSNAADIERALDAAHAARRERGKTSVATGARIPERIAERMEQNLELPATVETWDNGKPMREATAADMPLAIDHFPYFAGAIRAQEGGISRIDSTTVACHYHKPLGVGQLIPWNFPIDRIFSSCPLEACAPGIVDAENGFPCRMACTRGNTFSMNRSYRRSSPPGVLNVVNGFGLEAGKRLASRSLLK